MDLNNGYYQIPNGVYFNGPFSIAAWFFAREARSFSRLIDVGLATGSSNIILALFNDIVPKPFFRIKNSVSSVYSLHSSVNLTLNVWTHLAVTFDGAYLKMFMNGELVDMGLASAPINVNRTNNFIGRSWDLTNPNVNAIFDELRFYNRDLNQIEILALKSIQF